MVVHVFFLMVYFHDPKGIFFVTNWVCLNFYVKMDFNLIDIKWQQCDISAMYTILLSCKWYTDNHRSCHDNINSKQWKWEKAKNIFFFIVSVCVRLCIIIENQASCNPICVVRSFACISLWIHVENYALIFNSISVFFFFHFSWVSMNGQSSLNLSFVKKKKLGHKKSTTFKNWSEKKQPQ